LLVESLLYKSGYYWSEGRHSEYSLPLALRAWEIIEHMNDPQLTGMACYRIVASHLLLGNFQESIPWAEKGLAALDSEADTFFRFGGLLHAFIQSFMAISLAELGRFEEADDYGKKAYDAALKADHAYTLTVAGFGILHSLLLQERADEALDIIAHCLDQSSVHGVVAAIPWIAGRAAYAYAATGDTEGFERSIGILKDSENLSRSMRHGLAYAWAGRGCLVLGQLELAEELVNSILDAPMDDPEEASRAWCFWVLGETARARDESEAANSLLNTALGSARERAMSTLECYCLESFATLSASSGDPGKAAGYARDAAEIAEKTGHQMMAQRLQQIL